MKFQKSFLPLCSILLIVTACQTSSSKPEASITSLVTSTNSFSPMISREPTITNTTTLTTLPTRTPVPVDDLHSAGPYLLLDSFLYELDGSGRQELSKIAVTSGLYSPDMRWYAFTVGRNKPHSNFPDGEITLVIVDLRNHLRNKVVVIVPVDYLSRQEKMIDSFRPEFDAHVADYSASDYGVEQAMFSIPSENTMSWSPDSRYLAFAAIIDGNSSDVYLLDTDTDEIQRKENTPLNVGDITWSADGNWILYSEVVPGYWFFHSLEWDPTPLRVVSKNAINSSKSFTCFNFYPGMPKEDFRWISGSQITLETCIYHDGGDGWGNLWVVDVANGMHQVVWNNQWNTYALDPITKNMALFSMDSCDRSSTGLYHPALLIGPLFGNKRCMEIDSIYDHLIFRGGKKHDLVGVNDDSISGLTWEGKTDVLQKGVESQISISPDYRFMAVFGSNGLVLFDENDSLIYTSDKILVHSVVWKTNSRGLFFLTHNEAIYLSIDDFKPQIIAECNSACYSNRSISILPVLHVKALPNLRAWLPPIVDPLVGKSFWWKTHFSDLDQPGSKDYSVIIPVHSEWRWDFSWCTSQPGGLFDALNPLKMEFFISGEQVGEDLFRVYDHTINGKSCRSWGTILSGWQSGDKTDLEIRYTLDSPVDDGEIIYPAGEYRQIIHLTVE